jgi:hypothetical protein
MSSFFGEKRNKIEAFIKKADDNESYVHITKFLREILSDTDSYSNNCKYNIEHIGRIFISSIVSNINDDKEMDNLFIFLIRIAKEYEINSQTMLMEGGQALLEACLNKNLTYSKKFKEMIHFTFNVMPYKILNDKNQKELAKAYTFVEENVNRTVKEQLPEIDKEIKAMQQAIEDSKKVLAIQEQKFSFVVLNKAFYNLFTSKNNSKVRILFLLIGLAFLMVYVPGYYYFHQSEILNHTAKAILGNYVYANAPADLAFMNEEVALLVKNNGIIIYIFSMLQVVVIESIIIYFFRIVLHKYNSIVDQIVQLETKQSVVQFIEGYVKFKKDNNTNKDELEKFEDIVFSKISPNLQDMPNIPNVMDLVDGLGKAIKK